ncbi:MAG: nicotinate-nucleotide adenylyltransferase [Coriobacteriaceae bacterium]|nr:nicotinate-nucleotide adenylyltransferase [Coriobacteriaceae bacterium]
MSDAEGTASPGRIGVLGGTFDPPHLGHVELAHEAARRFDLGTVLLVPTGNPHFKQDCHVTAAAERAEMLRLAFADDLDAPGPTTYEVDLSEVERDGITYSVDTFEELHRKYPDADLFFIMGSDSARHVMTWYHAQRLSELCTLLVATRPGCGREEVEAAHEASDVAFAIDYFDFDAPDISSSDLRERISHGRSVEGLIPPAVITYIEKHRLYADGDE